MIEPRRIIASRTKTLLLLAIALGFVSIAAFLPSDRGDQQWRWWCGGFFALGVPIFSLLLVRPQWVALDKQGFTVGGGLARTTREVSWHDVERFFVYRLPRGGKMIGYTLVEGARPDTYLGDLAHRSGLDGVLPGTLAGSKERIAADLNAYRAAALAR